MGGAVFPPCYLTWGHAIVEVMKIMVTSFKKSHACTATLSAPSPAAGHSQPPLNQSNWLGFLGLWRKFVKDRDDKSELQILLYNMENQ